MIRLGLVWLLPMSLLMETPALAQTPQASSQNPLQVALCLNDWNRAITLLGPLIASEQITPARRQALVNYRQTLIDLRNQGSAVTDMPNCEVILSQYVESQPQLPSPPLDWEDAIAATYGIGSTVPPLPYQQQRQQAGREAAGLTFAQENEIESLSPFTPLDTASGSAVSAGSVSRGQAVYSFWGARGDEATLQVRVNEVRTGSLYTDDDSQLFLFDSQGTLLASNDDFTGLQSAIQSFFLPYTGRYYVAVTTYNNDPELDSERRVTRWNGSGGSDIEFTISVTGLTPLRDLELPR